MIVVNFMVEGQADEPIAERLLTEAGAVVGLRKVAGGKTRLDPKLSGLNRAARSAHPWFVLRDLDRDDGDGCPGDVVRGLLAGGNQSRYLILRLAVRTAEAWLLADAPGCSRFLGVSQAILPQRPDEISFPKHEFVALAGRSRIREVREGLVPGSASGRGAGPRYVELVGGFARNTWNPNRARTSSPSLDRALTRLAERIAEWS